MRIVAQSFVIFTSIGIFCKGANGEKVRGLRSSLGGGNTARGGAGGTFKGSSSDFVRRTLPPIATPTSGPTETPFRCNICSVPNAAVSSRSATVSFDSSSLSCADLETNGWSGDILEKDCESAQTLAASSCACVINGGFGTRDKPSTCSSNPLMSELDEEWLHAHNSRRAYWHAFYEVDFAEVCWDSSLADQAQYYADHLAANCEQGHDHSRPSQDSYQYCRQAGENLAFDTAPPTDARSPTEVTLSWTDREYVDSYPSDTHMTQVLWRPTRYIGCGMAHNSACQWKNVQVCRYVRYGNCNCNGDCRDGMLEDSSFCGPAEVEQTLAEYATCFDDWSR